MSIRERLIKMRDIEGITQAQISRRLGISKRQYIRYEKEEANLSAEILIKLVDIYGTNPTWLLTGTGSHKLNNRGLGYKLELIRKLNNMSRLEFCNKIGIDRTVYEKYYMNDIGELPLSAESHLEKMRGFKYYRKTIYEMKKEHPELESPELKAAEEKAYYNADKDSKAEKPDKEAVKQALDILYQAIVNM